jgi:hypothetical protein
LITKHPYAEPGRRDRRSCADASRGAQGRDLWVGSARSVQCGLEMALPKLKALLRAKALGIIDGLWRAIGYICDPFNPEECKNYLTAARYEFA